MNNLQKPPLGAQLDWTNPLCKGLRFFSALNEGVGPPADLVSGQQLTITSNGASALPYWDPTHSRPGWGFSCPADGSSAYLPKNSILPLVPPVTIACFYEPLSLLPDGQSCIFGVSIGSAGYTGYYSYAFANFNRQPSVWFTTDAPTQIKVNGVDAVSGPTFVAATIENGSQKLWVNSNSPTVTGSSAVTAFSTQSTGFVSVGPAYWKNIASYPRLFWGAIWNRALSSSEVLQLRANPWVMLRPSLSESWFQATAATYPTYPASLLAGF